MNRNRFCSLLSSSSSWLQQQQQLHLLRRSIQRQLESSSCSIPTSSILISSNTKKSINSYYRNSSTTSGQYQFYNESRINVINPSISRIETTTTTTTTSMSPSSPPPQPQQRYFSSWTGARGYDLTNDTLDDYDKEMGIPKINVSGYDENGFVVKNMIQKVQTNNHNNSSSGSKKNTLGPSFVDIQSNSEADSDGSVYMNGSIIVYPTGCFLWNIPTTAASSSSSSSTFPSSSTSHPKNRYSIHLEEPKHIIPIESLASIVLIRPHIEYVFIGCNNGYGSITNLNEIQYYFRNLYPISIVVEQMQLYNAIGTFNLLNAEDRQVAAALIADSTTTTGS